VGNETRSVFFPNRGEIGDWLLGRENKAVKGYREHLTF